MHGWAHNNMQSYAILFFVSSNFGHLSFFLKVRLITIIYIQLLFAFYK